MVQSTSSDERQRRIFISYRREDTQHVAGRLFDRLIQEFQRNQVFKDVDSIPFGRDFREHLDQAIDGCDVVLALIGDRWIEAKNSSGESRLQDPQDFVRLELEAALKRGIPIVPVLIGDVNMPPATALPASLDMLRFRQATRLRADPDFDGDVARLIRGLKPQSAPMEPSKPVRRAEDRRLLSISQRRSPFLLAGILVALLLMIWVVVNSGRRSDGIPTQALVPQTPAPADGTDEFSEFELRPGPWLVQIVHEQFLPETRTATRTVTNPAGESVQEAYQYTEQVPVYGTREILMDNYPLVRQIKVDGKIRYRVQEIRNDSSEHIWITVEPPVIQRSLPGTEDLPPPAPSATVNDEVSVPPKREG